MNRIRGLWAKTVIKLLLITGVLFFVIRVLIANWEGIAGHPWEVRWAPLGISFVFLILFYLSSFLLWQMLCREMDVVLPSSLNFGIWFFSQIGKYLPGKVWGAVGRIYLADRFGVRKMDSGVCLAYEAVFTTVGGGLIALLTVPFWAGAMGGFQMIWLLMGLAGTMVLIQRKVIGWIVNRSLQIFQLPAVIIPFDVFFLLRLLSVSCVLWISGGIGFFFLVDAVHPTHWSMVVPFAGIFAASCMMGILAFLSPAGIGIREAAFILLLSPHMPSEVAVVIAFGARLWMTCVEVVGIGLGGGWIAWCGRPVAHPEKETL